MNKLEELFKKIRKFRDDRDWIHFHNPKNLAGAISVEAGELLEKFFWLDDADRFIIFHSQNKMACI